METGEGRRHFDFGDGADSVDPRSDLVRLVITSSFSPSRRRIAANRSQHHMVKGRFNQQV